METNKNIKQDSILGQKAKALLIAAHEYWKVYQKELGNSAVVWLEGDNGHFILFTRSEYKDVFMATVSKEKSEIPVMFEPFTIQNE